MKKKENNLNVFYMGKWASQLETHKTGRKKSPHFRFSFFSLPLSLPLFFFFFPSTSVPQEQLHIELFDSVIEKSRS